MNHHLLEAVFFFGLFTSSFAARLSVSGGGLSYGGQKAYLNGANIAWNSYGYDFGNGNYDGSIESWMSDIGSAGGNAARQWVHVEGKSTPQYDGSGMVTSCDSSGAFLRDVVSFLDSAQQSDVLVIFTIWNGAVMSNQQYVDMIMDDNKLQSYLDNCLTDFARAVSGHPALGAWEAINEPEGSVQVSTAANACYDTTVIGQSGAGWTGTNIPMERFLNLIGKMNQVIRSNDSGGLCTLGSWAQFSQTDAFSNTKNHYTNQCLNGAGGSGSQLDFYQMHSYDWSGSWSPNAPFTVQASDYNDNKPILLGEYAGSCGAGTALADLHEYAYENGYVGGLSWHWAATGDCSDSRAVQRSALGRLAGRTDNGVVDINVG
uniref:GH5 family protein GH5A n=1 Tax=Limnoria quadripunctata TaxID=161573 RepID=D5IEF5_LIMQU|nr:GH5 family protein GH5A [Limnoria quadripunctata]